MSQEEFYDKVISQLECLNDTFIELNFAFFAAICGEFGRYPEITNSLLKSTLVKE